MNAGNVYPLAARVETLLAIPPNFLLTYQWGFFKAGSSPKVPQDVKVADSSP